MVWCGPPRQMLDLWWDWSDVDVGRAMQMLFDSTRGVGVGRTDGLGREGETRDQSTVVYHRHAGKMLLRTHGR